jgi:predicted Zn finger-like uncharacterized protein
MSLATRCPHCQTTFRVTHDQLKLRGGLVRCGSCKEIFNGVEHLLPPAPVAAPDEASATPGIGLAAPSPSDAQVAMPAAPPYPAASDETRSSMAGEVQEPAQAGNNSIDTSPASDDALAPAPTAANMRAPADQSEPDISAQAALAPPSPTVVPAPPAPSAPSEPSPPSAPLAAHTGRPAPADQDLDPLTRMTLMDMRPWPAAPAQDATRPADAIVDGPDDIDRAIDDLQNKPWREGGNADAAGGTVDPIDALDNEEPEFVRQARQQRQRRRRVNAALGAGSVVLLLLAILQAGIAFRTPIAAQWPATLPALTELCIAFDCKVDLPAQIEYVTLEASELQALPDSDNTFLLGTLLRNRSGVTQAWPHLELTLNDASDQPVVRRVLTPAEYLTPRERNRGLGPSSEKPIRLSFTLTQLKASGYRLYVFYP